MKAEKQVKEQARAALKGNWTVVLAAAGVTFAAFMLAQVVISVLLIAFQDVDFNTGEVRDAESPAYLATAFGGVLLMLAGSPLLNGFLKTAANVAVKKDCQITDVFFYFRGAGRYFRTLLMNLLLYLLFAFTFGVLNVSRYLEAFFPDWFKDVSVLTPEGAAVIAAGVVSGLIGALMYMLFVHWPLMYYALHDDATIGKTVFGTLGFSFRHFGKTLRLALSFAGWLALCFFVVPAFYVLPYFSVSAVLSAKWLFALEPGGAA